MAVREISWDEVLQAGSVIFGPGFSAAARTGGWHGELKTAYRRRALETHPDRAQHLGRTEAELAAEFRAVSAAYELLAAMRGGGAPAAPGPTAPPAPAPSETARAGGGPGPARGASRTEERTRSGWSSRRRTAPDHEAQGPSRPTAGRQAADRETTDRETADRRRRDRQAAGRATPGWATSGRAADRPPAAPQDGARRPADPIKAAGRLWRAGLPSRRLRLAEFLYYSGRLAWSDFVAAISWQRRQRPEVGRIAVDFGFLERNEVLEILTRRRLERSLGVPFGEFAVRHGYLTPFQVLAVLGQQLRLQRPLGQYFVERGLVSEPELEELRQRIHRHNARWAA